jgi:hypothetical protein
MQRFFAVTPPSVHNMILELERRGLIRRIPRQSRSIEVTVPAAELPTLRPIKPQWAGTSPQRGLQSETWVPFCGRGE